jgi:signal transduction histidine kinase
MVRGTDGRIWFSWSTGVGWIDPAHIRRNLVPPPISVRAVLVDGKARTATDSITLPQNTRALSIAYTAFSLAVPERVRFKYRFIGLDTTWQDAGARREAYFTNLAPGRYRFEVTAANDDGVWSIAPAAIDIFIPPTFVQTNAFLALCAAATVGAIWLFILWRQARIAASMRARFDATLAERTRVARELHDTLLTDVAGIRMQLDAVARVTGPIGIGATIAAIRDQASQAVVNARQAVIAMRTPAERTRPVHDHLAESARRIFAETAVTARVSLSGEPRRYAVAIEAEALRIGAEAMTNARQHADCHDVLVHCAYSERELRVEVRDDGRGFDPREAAANGHFGLVGMRERAGALRASLTIESAPGIGTTIRVVIPVDRAT